MEKERTRYRLAEAIRELMQKKTLDRISVREITDRCGVTRQTFYRSFRDKYDLVNWYFEKLAQQSFKQMGVSCTLREGLLKKFAFIKNEERFFAAAFSSTDCNSVVAYDYECIFRFYREIIEKKTGAPLSGDLEFLLEMYCRGSIDMTAKWARTGMQRSCEEMADLLIEAMPQRLEGLLGDLGSNRSADEARESDT